MSDFPLPGQRVTGAPVVLRRGNDRITRTASGVVVIDYGWFSPEAVARRRAWAESLANPVRAALKRAGWSA